MPVTQSCLSSKLNRVAVAMKAGELAAYPTAKQMKDGDEGVQLSWGPAMRR